MALVCWECVADLSSKKQIWCKLQFRSNKIEKRTGSGSGRLNKADAAVVPVRPNSLLSSGMLAPLVTTLLLIPVASYYTVAEDLKSLKEVYFII